MKVWDLNLESQTFETHQVYECLRNKQCAPYENDCIFDKFEWCQNDPDSKVMTGSYNDFRMFDRSTQRDATPGSSHREQQAWSQSEAWESMSRRWEEGEGQDPCGQSGLQ